MTQKFSAQRKRAFLTYLAQTGNQTLAAERAKVSRSWVCLHRSNDAEFDAAVRQAIEEAALRLQSSTSSACAQDERLGEKWAYLGGHELVVEAVVAGTGGSALQQAQNERKPGKRVQVRRARVKQWTPRVERRFLAALAATCNVKAACAEVGLWPPSAYNHRQRWPAFARAWDEAIEEGYVRIETALVEAAITHRNRTVSQTVRADRSHSLDDVPVAETPPMTVWEKIHLLHMHKHQVRGIGKAPGLPPHVATEDEAEAAIKKGLRRVESLLRREE